VKAAGASNPQPGVLEQKRRLGPRAIVAASGVQSRRTV